MGYRATSCNEIDKRLAQFRDSLDHRIMITKTI